MKVYVLCWSTDYPEMGITAVYYYRAEAQAEADRLNKLDEIDLHYHVEETDLK